MDLKPKGSPVVLCLLIIFALCKFSHGQNLCSVPSPIFVFPENNITGATVITITAEDEVTITITRQVPAGYFSINNKDLIADVVLDYEVFDKNSPYEVDIQCTKNGSTPTTLNLKIILEDVNDNPPAFAQSEYTLDVDELTKVNTSVGRITATDPDENDFRLFYRLESPEGEFGLKSALEPDILVKKLLDYDRVKTVSMTLYVQDTPLTESARASHTTSTTITVNIIDIDNRPPWFQPCTEHEVSTSKICLNSGYEGTINLNEQETGPLSLTPGPVHAIDGDKNINAAIVYTFLGGNINDTFAIDANTGSITMLKPFGDVGPIILTVMAYQSENNDQFSTSTVILRVVISSKYPPQFTKPNYEGFISEDADIDSLVLESKTSNKPLRVQATDEDFANGINPDIRFEILEGTDFSITPEGFILMAKAVNPGTVNLQMKVVDTTNEESSTASLTVEVLPGTPTTTTVPSTTVLTTTVPTTTVMTTTVITTDKTTNTLLTGSTSTPHPDTYTTPGQATGGQQGRGGAYRMEDMAAVGGSLAVIIILCLVCIGLLTCRIKNHNADWKKLSEASIFRSTLGKNSSSPKDGMQYTNESFQHDGDSGSVNSRLTSDLEMKLESGLRSEPRRVSPPEHVTSSSVSVLQAANSSTALDSGSLASSDGTDGEKEVKPILTKERRGEEGYKSVWFKQDIDPNNKEEVVIIPDRGELDQDDDDDHEEEEHDDEHRETDLDDELAEEHSSDHNSDSEDEERITSDL